MEILEKYKKAMNQILHDWAKRVTWKTKFLI